MGYDWYDQLVHIPYGTVSINGAKLATRTGNVLLLKDLFKMAIEKVGNIINEKNPNLENKAQVAEAVGVGAVVFYYLSTAVSRTATLILRTLCPLKEIPVLMLSILMRAAAVSLRRQAESLRQTLRRDIFPVRLNQTL